MLENLTYQILPKTDLIKLLKKLAYC